MYKIIGGDGKEYGPISLEQLKNWLAEGRVNADTHVKAEGSPDWKPLGDLPEFAHLRSTVPPRHGTPPLPPPSPSAPVNAEALAAQILARGYTLRIGQCVSRGWELVKADFWLTVGAIFVGSLIMSGAGIPCIGPLISLVCSGPIMGGIYLFLLRRIRNEQAQFGDIFLGFSLAFLPLFLAYLVSTLLTTVGILLLLLPGIYLAVSWSFTIALVIDKKLDFWPAMELSRKVVTKNWWTIFGLMFVNGMVILLGLICCFVGVLVAAPVAMASLMYAYEDIFNSDSTTTI